MSIKKALHFVEISIEACDKTIMKKYLSFLGSNIPSEFSLVRLTYSELLQ